MSSFRNYVSQRWSTVDSNDKLQRKVVFDFWTKKKVWNENWIDCWMIQVTIGMKFHLHAQQQWKQFDNAVVVLSKCHDIELTEFEIAEYFDAICTVPTFIFELKNFFFFELKVKVELVAKRRTISHVFGSLKEYCLQNIVNLKSRKQHPRRRA